MLPVWILGGFGAPDVFYTPLTWWLHLHGITAYVLSSGTSGTNIHDIGTLPARFEETRYSPCILIGHSLGGIQSVWLADNFPTVQHVITLGSPLLGCPIPWFESFVRTWIGASEELQEEFVKNILYRVAPRLTTFTTDRDILAPPSSCERVGRENHILHTPWQMTGEIAHLSLPYWPKVRTKLLHSIRQESKKYENHRTRE